MGDSTSNATDEWVYLTSTWISENILNHNVKYKLWNDTLQAYEKKRIIK